MQLRQPFTEPFVEGQDVPHVVERVGDLRLRQRPARPVGQRLALFHRDPEQPLDELRIADLGAEARHRRGDLRVDDRRWDTPGQGPEQLEILLAGVAIASANDAATAVSEALAGSEDIFVERMNAKAADLGLAHTRFANPHGLTDPMQRTTAHDMATLAQALLREYPESQQVLGQTGFQWRGRQYQRRIGLFRDPGGVDALKTGYTMEAGYNLAVAAEKAGNRVLCIILGAETRGLSFLDAGRLLKFGFGEPVKQVRRESRKFRSARGAARPLVRPLASPVRR